MIEKGKIYQIKDEGSEYFSSKYGTSKPLIQIEGTDQQICGHNWSEHNAIVTIVFMERMAQEKKMSKALTEQVYCCKIESDGFYLSEFVLESEIEECPGTPIRL